MPHQMGVSSCLESALHARKMNQQFETIMSIQLLFMCPINIIKRGLHIIVCAAKCGDSVTMSHIYHIRQSPSLLLSSFVAAQSQESRRAAFVKHWPPRAFCRMASASHDTSQVHQASASGPWALALTSALDWAKDKPIAAECKAQATPPRSSRKRRRYLVLKCSESFVDNVDRR